MWIKGQQYAGFLNPDEGWNFSQQKARPFDFNFLTGQFELEFWSQNLALGSILNTFTWRASPHLSWVNMHWLVIVSFHDDFWLSNLDMSLCTAYSWNSLARHFPESTALFPDPQSLCSVRCSCNKIIATTMKSVTKCQEKSRVTKE